MKIKKQRLIYKSSKTARPIILEPKSSVWYNDISTINFVWKYNGSDLQEKYEIECANNIDFEDSVVNEITSSVESISINNLTGVSELIDGSGTFYWRIRTKGWSKSEISEWSSTDLIQIDLGNPTIYGIDIISPTYDSPTDIKTKKCIAETHSNMVMPANPIHDMGFFIGRDNIVVSNLLIKNNSEMKRTFFGKIYPQSITEDEKAIGYPFFSWDGDVDPKHYEKNEDHVSFAVVLDIDESFTIISSTCSKIGYKLYISNYDLYTSNSTAYPTDFSNKVYSNTATKEKTFIGSAETNPLSMNDNLCVILNNYPSFIPFGSNYFIPNSSSETQYQLNKDSSVVNGIETTSFKTNYSLDNIKNGDSIWMQRSYDAFQSSPSSTSFLLSSPINEWNPIREWFYITDVDKTTKKITPQFFDSTICNFRYPDTNTYNTLPKLSDSTAYSKIEVKISGTKVRTDTIIIDTTNTNNFSSQIYLPSPTGSNKPIGNNGLSTRWIGIEWISSTDSTDKKIYYYPIYQSNDSSLVIVGDLLSDFSDCQTTTELNFFIAGDNFIFSSYIFDTGFIDLYLHIGIEDTLSGINKVSIKQINHEMITTIDLNGNQAEYLNRIIPSSIEGEQWHDYTDLIPLKDIKMNNDEIIEFFVNAKDRANNIAYSNYNEMQSQLIKNSSLKEIKLDFLKPSGTFFVNKGEKKLSNGLSVVDIFPFSDNYGINYFNIFNYPIHVNKNRSYNLQDPYNLYITWQKWPAIGQYTFSISEVDSDDNIDYFKIKVSDGDFSLMSDKDLTSIYTDLIGTMLTIDEVSKTASYPIVNIVGADGLILKGQKPDGIKAGQNVTINTLKSYPTGDFTGGGIFGLYYKDNSDLDADSFVLDNIVKTEINNTIDFTNDTTFDADFSIRWNGWFWTNYDAYYKIIVSGSGEAKIITDSYDGITTLMSNRNISSSQSIRKYFYRGWNKILLDYHSGRKVGSVVLKYKSEPLDTIYKRNNKWDFPIVSSIDETNNAITVSMYNVDEFLAFDVSNKWAMIGMLDATTGLLPEEHDNIVGAYYSANAKQDPTTSKTMVELESSTLYLSNYKQYFIQPDSEYDIFTIAKSSYPMDSYGVLEEEPYNYILIEESAALSKIKTSNSYYRLSQSKLQISSISDNKIVFKPAIIGEWDSVSIASGIITFTDNTKNWEIDSLCGLVVVPDISSTTEKYYILNNTKTQITVANYYLKTDSSLLVGTSYRIGAVVDIASVNTIIYVPIGEEEQIISKENLTRNAGKFYVKTKDFFGNNYTDMKAVSLDGYSGSGPSVLTGAIIDLDINNGRYTTFYASSSVYDANQIDNAVGVYESLPISSPIGFAFWSGISWDEYCPDSTSVEIYIRTAETEEELYAKTYNEDAIGVLHEAFTKSSYDIPVDDPTAVDISCFTTDGSKDANGEIKRLKWLQFKVVLKTGVEETTPKIGNIKITYTTFKETVIFSKNFELNGNILQGFLSPNTEIPTGTNIVWGINTSNELDFNKYQIIPIDEAFQIIEPQAQFRLAAKLISSGTSVPKIFDINFKHVTDGDSDLLNNSI